MISHYHLAEEENPNYPLSHKSTDVVGLLNPNWQHSFSSIHIILNIKAGLPKVKPRCILEMVNAVWFPNLSFNQGNGCQIGLMGILSLDYLDSFLNSFQIV